LGDDESFVFIGAGPHDLLKLASPDRELVILSSTCSIPCPKSPELGHRLL
jgi:hypothetical protein